MRKHNINIYNKDTTLTHKNTHMHNTTQKQYQQQKNTIKQTNMHNNTNNNKT